MLEILGAPVAELALVVDAPYGQVAVRLVHVSPDGTGRLITRGYLNLAHRDGLGCPSPVVPGEPMQVRVPMRETSAVIAPGARLRLAVSGADFPLAWPTPGPFTLKLDPNGSRLHLPVVPPRGRDRDLEIPPAPSRPSPVETLESAHHLDIATAGSRKVLRRRVADRQLQPGRDDLVYSNRQDVEVSVDAADPLATRAWSRSETGLERGDWKVRTVGEVEITGDAGAFRLSIVLDAMLDGQPFAHREWDEVIPRTWA
jgi:hypothetical protein